MAKGIKIGKNGLVDIKKFGMLGKTRNKAIENSPISDDFHSYRINDIAASLHRDHMDLVVTEINERGNAKEFVLSSPDSTPLPSFRAGSYVSLKVKIGDSYTSRPYSISSSPKDAERGKLSVTIENYEEGFVAPYLYSNLKKGDHIISSSPTGTFHYDPLRDKSTVVALAGGSGITPFLSMAYAIRDGYEDFDLLILYGNRTEDTILFKDELEDIASATPKVKVVHILSDEKKEGYEYGFINSELIKKYAPSEYSVFACGPGNFYSFMKKDIKKLNLPDRLIRFEMEAVTKDPYSDPAFPEEAKGKSFIGLIRQCGKEYRIELRSDENILTSIERAGIKAPSSCRSGVCAWCRSRLVEGEAFYPEVNEYRRKADKDLGYIHPCAAFPLSDLVLEIGSEL